MNTVLTRLTADNLSEKLFRRVPEERNTTHQELVEDDPHRPPVHRLPVALPEDDLGGNVLRCAAHLQRKGTKSSENTKLKALPVSHTPLRASTHLLVDELPRVFLHVALAQIGGHVHQANFGEAKVCEFDVAHGCDQQAVG